MTVTFACGIWMGEVHGQTDGGFPQDQLDELNQLVQSLGDQRQFSGTVLIAQNGELAFEKSVGFSNVHEKQALDAQASFRLASVSKQFTAMAILILMEEGKLRLDDEIQQHLPNLPYPGITIRHLLHHTSGLPDYMPVALETWDRDPGPAPAKRQLASNRDIVDLFVKHQPKARFKPGDKFEYSNTGYLLLGYLIEQVSGQSAGDFLQERIFDPLEMKHSAVYRAEETFPLPHRVFGFQYSWKESVANIDNDWHFLNGVFGDGAVYASAYDLLKWDRGLYSEKLVSQDTLDLAYQLGTLNDGEEIPYGFGWIIAPYPSGKVVSHSGGWVGFRTYICRDLANQSVYIALSNNSATAFDQIVSKLDEVRQVHRPVDPATPSPDR